MRAAQDTTAVVLSLRTGDVVCRRASEQPSRVAQWVGKDRFEQAALRLRQATNHDANMRHDREARAARGCRRSLSERGAEGSDRGAVPDNRLFAFRFVWHLGKPA
ncbi:hypothetical protein MTO96_023325 [Rhipicephalus appendiculatus]